MVGTVPPINRILKFPSNRRGFPHLLQYHDLIGIHHRAEAMGDDQTGGRPGFFTHWNKKQFEHVEVSEVMGIPLVIIHFCLGFYNPAILGCPQFKRKPPMSRSKLKILKLETEGFPCSKTITNKKRVPPTFVSSRRWRCSAGKKRCTGWCGAPSSLRMMCLAFLNMTKKVHKNLNFAYIDTPDSQQFACRPKPFSKPNWRAELASKFKKHRESW